MEGGGKPPPRLGGLGGSEVQKERKIYGSEKKENRIEEQFEKNSSEDQRNGDGTAGDLHADPVGRRILSRLVLFERLRVFNISSCYNGL